MYIRNYIYTHTHTRIHTCIHKYTNMHPRYIDIRMHKYMYVCMYEQTLEHSETRFRPSCAPEDSLVEG